MDNDDLRRGKPTCHIKFDEATAILAGDALQPLAFELICEINIKEETKTVILSKLASASGFSGMVGGQVKDIQMNQEVTVEELDVMHFRKTGRLIQTSLEIGGLLSNLEEEKIKLLKEVPVQSSLPRSTNVPAPAGITEPVKENPRTVVPLAEIINPAAAASPPAAPDAQPS